MAGPTGSRSRCPLRRKATGLTETQPPAGIVPGGFVVVAQGPVTDPPDCSRAFVYVSTDDGATWSVPRALPSGGTGTPASTCRVVGRQTNTRIVIQVNAGSQSYFPPIIGPCALRPGSYFRISALP
jgi:hypothetical protein